MNLFEYAVIYKPKKNNPKNEGKAELLIKPTCVLADSLQAVQMIAARSIPEKYADRLSEVEILTRPF